MEFRAMNPVLGERWMLGLGRAERDEKGVLFKMAGLNLDITERKRQEELRKLLLNELNHRVKNTLATVKSIAMQTLRTSPSVDEARQRLDTRLIALAKAHDVLTSENWGGAFLSEIVKQATAPYHTYISICFSAHNGASRTLY
jgi:two-component sensor histidine kinase